MEGQWPREREVLIEDASRRLDATLRQAVDLARSLAARAVQVSAASATRAEQFARLEAAIRPEALEQGVAVFDSAGQPVAWAGRHRVPVRLPSDELDAFITPFYAVLTAQRQDAGRTAASQVLLAADIAVPDREHSVAAQFAARTGVGLEFFPPRTAPTTWTDVFDYCLPQCKPQDAAVVPDTLFSVRMVPPAQGDRKLQLVDGGRRWAAIAASLTLVLLALAGGMATRYAAVAAFAALYLFTPAGESLGLGAAFSPATYYVGALGPFGASAGTCGMTIFRSNLVRGRRVMQSSVRHGQHLLPASGLKLHVGSQVRQQLAIGIGSVHDDGVGDDVLGVTRVKASAGED